MNELSLFAGAGGSILAGTLLQWQCVCAVESDRYCQAILFERQRDNILTYFPVWDDVRTFNGTPWRGLVDVVTAGFPCQPFSVAGKQAGEADKRNLWPDTIRIINEVRPEWVLLENVPGLFTIRDGSGRPYFGRILQGLAEGGFDAEWGVFSAAASGAPHIRKRVFLLAHAGGQGLSQSTRLKLKSIRKPEKESARRQPCGRTSASGNYWQTEPPLGRVADGVAHRVDRLRALGNGWVPQVAARAFIVLKERFSQFR